MSTIAKAYLQGAPKNVTKRRSETQRQNAQNKSLMQTGNRRSNRQETEVGLNQNEEGLKDEPSYEKLLVRQHTNGSNSSVEKLNMERKESLTKSNSSPKV